MNHHSKWVKSQRYSGITFESELLIPKFSKLIFNCPNTINFTLENITQTMEIISYFNVYSEEHAIHDNVQNITKTLEFLYLSTFEIKEHEIPTLTDFLLKLKNVKKATHIKSCFFLNLNA